MISKKYKKEKFCENIEKLCDWIYMRQDFDKTLLIRILQGLLDNLNIIMSESNVDDAPMDGYVQSYLAKYKMLTGAIDRADMILIADILHHDFVEDLLRED
jgi:hypothetical protein